MLHTIAQSARENNAPVVNCGEITGEQVTGGKYRIKVSRAHRDYQVE